MFDSPIPLKSIYREAIEFALKENADSYIQAGWQPITFVGNFNDTIRAKKFTVRYRVGWLRGAGEPIRPPILDEVPPPRFQDFGPSAS